MDEAAVRASIVAQGYSLFWRGLTAGTSGNISARTGDGWLVSPTGSCLGELATDRLSRLDSTGRHVDGDPPTKEVPLHLRMYQLRPRLRAVVHLHSPYAVAASILADADPADVLPPLTGYYVMRVGRLPLVPYARPGSPELADFLARHLGDASCALLANHGPVAGGEDLTEAVNAIEEIEQTARLWLLVAGRRIRPLTPTDVAEIASKNR